MKYIVNLSDPFVMEKMGGVKFLKIPIHTEAGDNTVIGTGIVLTPYIEPDHDEIHKEAYRRGIREGYKKCMQENKFGPPCASCMEREDGFTDGRDMAWECAKKIYLPADRGGLGFEAVESIFNTDHRGWIFKHVSAAEAVEKILCYEFRKKEEENGENISD